MVINKVLISRLVKKHNLELLLLHGSQVHGRVHDKSDIDVAFLGNGKIDIIDLVGDLMEVFGNKVDVTDLSRADPLLLKNVMAGYKLLYSKGEAEENLRLKTFKRYVDYLPYLKKEAEFVNNYYQIHGGK